MATLQSIQVANKLPPPTSCGYEPVVVFGDFTVPATIAANDVVEMLCLPAGYVLVDTFADTEDLGGTITVDTGILSGTFGTTGVRTCGAEFMSAKAFGTAGIYRADVGGFGRIAPTTADRGIGFKFSAATTPTAGAKVRLSALIRPQLEAA